MNTAGVIVLVVVLVVFFGLVGWIFFARWRAQRLGLPSPSWSSFIPFRSSQSSYGIQPAPGGIRGWFSDKFHSLKNPRTATGAYEGPGPSGNGTRTRAGFGPLDPDDAWDARVGHEADAYYYNEEQELGLRGNNNNSSRLDVSNTAYLGSGALGGSTYDMNVPVASNAAATAATTKTATTTTTPGTTRSAVDDDEMDTRGRPRGRSPNTNTGDRDLNPFDDNADPSNISMRGVSPRPMTDAEAQAQSNANKSNKDGEERRSIFRENV